MRSFEVVAVFDIGMSEYDSSVVYMPLDDAQEYFMSEGAVTAIEFLGPVHEIFADLIKNAKNASIYNKRAAS
jgi:ABC-type lipoprotein release transport system permease subunit